MSIGLSESLVGVTPIRPSRPRRVYVGLRKNRLIAPTFWMITRKIAQDTKKKFQNSPLTSSLWFGMIVISNHKEVLFMSYNEWLTEVCKHTEDLMDCTTQIYGYGVRLKFKPFGTILWSMMFEEGWLGEEYNLYTNPKATAYNMAILVRREWWKVISRKDEHND